MQRFQITLRNNMFRRTEHQVVEAIDFGAAFRAAQAFIAREGADYEGMFTLTSIAVVPSTKCPICHRVDTNHMHDILHK